MNVIAVTACPTGIAHTYMAADALRKAATKQKIQIKIETQGAMGIDNLLTAHDIARADVVLIVSDIEIEQAARFRGSNAVKIAMEEVLLDAEKALTFYCRSD